MKILLPVEDSETAEVQTEFVMNHKWPEKSEIRIMHVLHSIMLERNSVSRQVYLDEVMKEAKSEAIDFMIDIVKTIKKKCPDLAVGKQLREGDAISEILQAAVEWPAELIVLASHGRKGIGKIVLGSVAYSVLTESPCQVIIIGEPRVESGDDDDGSWKKAPIEVKMK